MSSGQFNLHNAAVGSGLRMLNADGTATLRTSDVPPDDCCCEGLCFYVAIRCPGENVGCNNQIAVPCAFVDAHLPIGASIVFKCAAAGDCCYFVSTGSTQIDDAAGLIVCTPTAEFIDCAACLDPGEFPPCAIGVDECLNCPVTLSGRFTISLEFLPAFFCEFDLDETLAMGQSGGNPCRWIAGGLPFPLGALCPDPPQWRFSLFQVQHTCTPPVGWHVQIKLQQFSAFWIDIVDATFTSPWDGTNPCPHLSPFTLTATVLQQNWGLLAAPTFELS